MKKVYVCGMYRSGTTLIFNILQEMRRLLRLDISIIKVHQDWVGKAQQGDISLYSYRDVRDVVISFCFKEGTSFEDFKIHGKNVESFCEWVIAYDRKIKQYKQDNPEDIMVFRYESDILNSEYGLCNKISNFLSLPSTFNKEISKDLSLQKTKEFVSTLKQLDKETLFWPNHIKDGKTQKYRELTKSQLDRFNRNNALKTWLKENKYE